MSSYKEIEFDKIDALLQQLMEECKALYYALEKENRESDLFPTFFHACEQMRRGIEELKFIEQRKQYEMSMVYASPEIMTKKEEEEDAVALSDGYPFLHC